MTDVVMVYGAAIVCEVASSWLGVIDEHVPTGGPLAYASIVSSSISIIITTPTIPFLHSLAFIFQVLAANRTTTCDKYVVGDKQIEYHLIDLLESWGYHPVKTA